MISLASSVRQTLEGLPAMATFIDLKSYRVEATGNSRCPRLRVVRKADGAFFEWLIADCPELLWLSVRYPKRAKAHAQDLINFVKGTCQESKLWKGLPPSAAI